MKLAGWEKAEEARSCRRTQRLRGGLERRVDFQLGLETTQSFINCVLLFTWRDPAASTAATQEASEETSSTLFYNLLQLDSWQMHHLCQVTTVLLKSPTPKSNSESVFRSLLDMLSGTDVRRQLSDLEKLNLKMFCLMEFKLNVISNDWL